MSGSESSDGVNDEESSGSGVEGDAGAGPPAEADELAEENARLRAELENLSELAATDKRARRRRARRVLSGIFVVLTSLCVVATTVGVWTQRTLADTDRYVALVGPLVESPAVVDAMTIRLTDEIFRALDVDERVRAALESIPNLPSAAVFLAGPITSGARNIIQDQVRSFLTSDAFVNLWSEMNRALHEKLKALLNEDYEELPNVEINGGEVRLNLVSVAAEILRRIAQSGIDALGIDATIPTIPPGLDSSAAIQQLGSALGVSLPADFGQVTIMTVDQLDEYQTTVRTAKRLVGALFVLSLVLIAATILIAPDRRRTLIWLGVGITVALFLGGVLLRRVRGSLIDSITTSGAKGVARDAFAQVGASLRRIGLLVLAVAVLAAVVAYLAGRPTWFANALAWVRRVTAKRPQGSELDVWVAGHADLVRIAGLAVVAVFLFLTGIDWIPVLVAAAFAGLVLWGVAAAERGVGALPADEGATTG